MAAAVAAVAGLVAAVVRRRWIVVTVIGGSMLPGLRDGDVVLARRRDPRTVRVGDVVVVDRSGIAAPRRWIVKRVAAMAGDPLPAGIAGSGPVPPGSLVVLGDNGGDDSRRFGALPVGRVLAVVVRSVPALSRAERFVTPGGAVLDPLTGRLVPSDGTGAARAGTPAPDQH